MVLNSTQKKDLQRQAQQLSPCTSVGKGGPTCEVIEHISRYLKAHKLAKVKILSTYMDENDVSKKELAFQLASQTHSELVKVIGFVVILYRP